MCSCERVPNYFLPPTMLVALLFGLHISLLTDNWEASCQWPHCLIQTFAFMFLSPPSLCQSQWRSGVRWKAEAFSFGTLYFNDLLVWFFFFFFFLFNEVIGSFKGQTYTGRVLACLSEDSEKVSLPLFVLSSVCYYHNSVKKKCKMFIDNSFGFVTVYICRMWMYFLHVLCL